jgi:hypothetical protein
MTFCSYSVVTKPVAYHFIAEHYFRFDTNNKKAMR